MIEQRPTNLRTDRYFTVNSGWFRIVNVVKKTNPSMQYETLTAYGRNRPTYTKISSLVRSITPTTPSHAEQCKCQGQSA